MGSNDMSQLWSHLAELHQALADMLETQQQAGVRGAPLPALAARLQALQQEAERQAGQDGDEKPRFGEIEVERINVIEPDGSLRMTISGKSRAPDPLVDGVTFKRGGGHQAGMIFFNEDGDECGGLIFGGQSRADGHRAVGEMLFDQFKQDQTIGLQYSDVDGRRMAALKVWDRPNAGFSELAADYDRVWQIPEGPERVKAVDELRAAGMVGAVRVVVGKVEDGTAIVDLHDAHGRPRLHLSVDAEGTPQIAFLDADGAVTYRLPPVSRA